MESDGTRIYKDQERPKLIVAEDVPHLFHSQIQNTGLFVEEEAVALFVLMFWPAKWSLQVPKFVWTAWCVEWKIHRLLNVSLSFGGQCLPGPPSTYDRTRIFHTPWQSWYLCAPNVEQPPLVGASGFSAAFSFWMELKPTKTSEEAAICWPPFASPGRNEQVLIFCNPSQLSYTASLKLPGWVWLWPCLTFNLSFNLLNSSCLVHLSDFRLQLWQGICSLLWIRHKTLTLVKGCAFHWSTVEGRTWD